MKKIGLLLALTFVFSTLTACHHKMGQVSGSGNRQKQQRDVGAFTSISTDGAFHIEVVAQKSVSVEVEADDNILPLVSTDVSNNTLYIKSNKSYSVRQPVVVRITVPDLASVTSNGAGRIDVSDLNNERFEIELNGSPVITAAGKTNMVDIDTSGSGAIDTNRLRAARAVVDSKGVSKVEVYAADQLDVTVSGPSTVIYSGSPVVNKTVNGPGSVQKKPSTPA